MGVPAELLQKALVPHGHLGDIAQRCNVRIDLGVEVMPCLQQVSITGSIACNTVAAYFLQERAAQYGTHAGVGAAQGAAGNAPAAALVAVAATTCAILSVAMRGHQACDI